MNLSWFTRKSDVQILEEKLNKLYDAFIETNRERDKQILNICDSLKMLTELRERGR